MIDDKEMMESPEQDALAFDAEEMENALEGIQQIEQIVTGENIDKAPLFQDFEAFKTQILKLIEEGGEINEGDSLSDLAFELDERLCDIIEMAEQARQVLEPMFASDEDDEEEEEEEEDDDDDEDEEEEEEEEDDY